MLLLTLPIVETQHGLSLMIVILRGGVGADDVFPMEGKKELLVLIVVHLVVNFILHGPLNEFDDIKIPHELVLASFVDFLILDGFLEVFGALFKSETVTDFYASTFFID